MTRAANDNITAAFRVGDLNTEIDSEPRVLDVLLGERLGMAHARNIRDTIAKRRDELALHGTICTSAIATSAKGGRPGTAYYLNEPQALLICMFANTAKAAQVRKMLIDVFMEYRRSQGMVKVQAHERRTSTRIEDAMRLKTNIDRLERATADIAAIATPRYLTAMVVDGEPVVVDVHDHNVAPNQRAVVMKHGGELAIEHVERLEHNPTMFAKPRGAYGPRKPSPYGGTMREAVVIVGRVIEAAPRPAGEMRLLDTPAGRDAARLAAPAKQLAAPALPHVARHKRDVAIRKMAIAGLGNKEIAEIAGVSYWIAARVAGETRKVRARSAGRAA